MHDTNTFDILTFIFSIKPSRNNSGAAGFLQKKNKQKTNKKKQKKENFPNSLKAVPGEMRKKKKKR